MKAPRGDLPAMSRLARRHGSDRSPTVGECIHEAIVPSSPLSSAEHFGGRTGSEVEPQSVHSAELKEVCEEPCAGDGVTSMQLPAACARWRCC